MREGDQGEDGGQEDELMEEGVEGHVQLHDAYAGQQPQPPARA